MWKEESSAFSCVQEPGRCKRWHLLPFAVTNLTRGVDQFAPEFPSHKKRALAEICNQLQAAGVREWPLNFEAERVPNLKLRPTRSDVFDSGNYLLAPALQYIPTKLQPLGVRLASDGVPV